jgi:hypothetical protein
MTCKVYDLVLIPFPYADLSSSKKRPVLVLTAPDSEGAMNGQEAGKWLDKPKPMRRKVFQRMK